GGYTSIRFRSTRPPGPSGPRAIRRWKQNSSLSYEKRGSPRRYVTPAEATSTERAVNSPRKPPERRSDNGEDVPPSEGYPHRLPHGPGGGLLRRRPGGLRGWRADDRRAGPRRRVRSRAGRLRSQRRRR